MKGPGGKIEDQATVHLRVEGEVKVIESLVRVAEAGVFAAPFEEAIGAPGEFVGDQRGEQVNGRHGLGLCLPQAGFEYAGHATEAELAQRLLQFDEVHSGWFSWALLSIKSR